MVTCLQLPSTVSKFPKSITAQLRDPRNTKMRRDTSHTQWLHYQTSTSWHMVTTTTENQQHHHKATTPPLETLKWQHHPPHSQLAHSQILTQLVTQMVTYSHSNNVHTFSKINKSTIILWQARQYKSEIQVWGYVQAISTSLHHQTILSRASNTNAYMQSHTITFTQSYHHTFTSWPIQISTLHIHSP